MVQHPAGNRSLKQADKPSSAGSRSLDDQRRVKRTPGFVEEIFQIIRGDIMSLRIPPDTRISIDQLARELGVSQTPIREALSMLEAIGLVTRRQYFGYCSAPQLSRTQFDHLYEMRMLIEPYAARCAAERMSKEELGEVAALAKKMESEGSQASYDTFADQDSEFHDRIAAGSGNPIIQESLARLHSHLHIFRLRFHTQVAVDAVGEHMELIDALLARDGTASESAMRRHIERSYSRLIPFADG